MSDSVQPPRWQPTRLPRPWDSSGKNTGVACHFLLQCIKVKSESEVARSCPTPSDPMDCRLLHPWDFPGESTGVGCHCLLLLIAKKHIFPKKQDNRKCKDKMPSFSYLFCGSNFFCILLFKILWSL